MRSPRSLHHRLAVLGVAGAIVAGALPRAARADVYAHINGTRSMAMGGAHRGLANSNEALWLNPAGMALTHRYSMDLQYDYAPADSLHHLNASVVDSKSGPVAGGLAYVRDFGGDGASLNRSHLGIAYAISEAVGLGLTVHNVAGDYTTDGIRHKAGAWNGTAGLSIALGEALGVGFAYQNVLPGSPLLPSLIGIGAAANVFGMALAGDLDILRHTGARHRLTWRSGGEVFVGQALALRGGWHWGSPDSLGQQEPIHFISGGAGLVTEGAAVNVTLERAVDRAARWAMQASLQFFL